MTIADNQVLPANILMGTSSWAYSGWQGVVYRRPYRDDQDFKANCLAEYAQYPLFRTVGIDSSFYAPPNSAQLQHYATLVPDNFQWISKVWEEITIPVYPQHKRYGAKANQPNPNFLNSDLFISSTLDVYEQAQVTAHLGAFVFEFQLATTKYQLSPGYFLEKLNSFLSSLPQTFHYSVEIRDSQLLMKDYFAVLNQYKVAHCFNHWSYMPPLREQMIKAASCGGLSADFQIVRALTPLGLSYAQAVKQFAPYEAIKKELPLMREDLKTFAKRAIKRNIPAFIIVNNRTEGHAPGTIKALTEMINTDINPEIQGE